MNRAPDKAVWALGKKRLDKLSSAPPTAMQGAKADMVLQNSTDLIGGIQKPHPCSARRENLSGRIPMVRATSLWMPKTHCPGEIGTCILEPA